MCKEQIRQILDFIEIEMLAPYADSKKRAATMSSELREKLPELEELLNSMSCNCESEPTADNAKKADTADKKTYANFTTIFP